MLSSSTYWSSSEVSRCPRGLLVYLIALPNGILEVNSRFAFAALVRWTHEWRYAVCWPVDALVAAIMRGEFGSLGSGSERCCGVQ